MTLFFFAASNMDMIIGIIAVVGWILAQILGKKKGATPPQDNSTPVGAPSNDPRDELRKFFEELENPPEELAPAPLKPTAPSGQLKTRPAPKGSSSGMLHLAQPQKPNHNTGTPPGLRCRSYPESIGPAEPSLLQQAARDKLHPLHSLPMPGFRNLAALRQCIIASEILKKPIALL
jgi:hypothetical protein